jgi:hypothetical protein
MTIGLVKDWHRLRRRTDDTHAHYAGEDVGEKKETVREKRVRESTEKHVASPKFREAMKAALAQQSALMNQSARGPGKLTTPQGRKSEVKKLAGEIRAHTKLERGTSLNDINAAQDKVLMLRNLAAMDDDEETKKLADEIEKYVFSVSRNRDTRVLTNRGRKDQRQLTADEWEQVREMRRRIRAR